MRSLLDKIKNLKGCSVLPKSGFPVIDLQANLPEDLKTFYGECGGIKFFSDSDYAIEIVAPDNFQLSNPEILSEGWETDIPPDDISNSWYIIAAAGPEQRISIDLGVKRIGQCYDSFWDIHASPGESPIVSVSFTQLLENIIDCQGGYWFWLADDFSSLGDAYK
ncbi:MAG: SMI1/KNR4 family protein [Algicola sp.]|nr:SMI1/KNR4 family protein [Algicola sp.]